MMKKKSKTVYDLLIINYILYNLMKGERILFVRNLPYKISAQELYDLFGEFGAIRQIRKGNITKTRGTAFVVYNNIEAAKKAQQKLNGYKLGGRYLVCLFYKKEKHLKKEENGNTQQNVE